jgi:hypothetical protein
MLSCAIHLAHILAREISACGDEMFLSVVAAGLETMGQRDRCNKRHDHRPKYIEYKPSSIAFASTSQWFPMRVTTEATQQKSRPTKKVPPPPFVAQKWLGGWMYDCFISD